MYQTSTSSTLHSKVHLFHQGDLNVDIVGLHAASQVGDTLVPLSCVVHAILQVNSRKYNDPIIAIQGPVISGY